MDTLNPTQPTQLPADALHNQAALLEQPKIGVPADVASADKARAVLADALVPASPYDNSRAPLTEHAAERGQISQAGANKYGQAAVRNALR